MRIVYLIIFASFVFFSCKTAEKQTAKINVKIPGSDSIVKSIEGKSDILIHQYSNASIASGDHIILYRQKSNWRIAVYQTKDYMLVGTNGVFNYKEWSIKKASADSILNTFKKNKLLLISKNNEGCEEKELQRDSNNQLIACRHEHSSRYSIVFKINKETNIKTYNDVFFANTCCPGNNDRTIFVTCFNALNSLANNFIKKY